MLHHSNWKVLNRSLKRPRNKRDNIVVPARIARIAPMAYGENLFSVPNKGKKTTSTSATEEIASEIYIAAIIPGRFARLIADLKVPSEFAFPSTVGRSLRHLITGIRAIIVRTTASKNAFDVDFGNVSLDPETMEAIIGPSMCPTDALKV